MIVKNEGNWIYYAINSILPYASQVIIYDTGSDDKTVQIVKSIKNSKILFEEKGKVNVAKMIVLRNEQIKKTKTEWFMLADGDEVYPERIFNRINLNSIFYGIYLRNYMCVGDVYHSFPESYGKYHLCGHLGHLNMRFYKVMTGWKWWGKFPLEYYGPQENIKINDMCNKLQFVDEYYWHMSFLERSSMKKRNHIKYDLGEKIKGEIPVVFSGKALKKRSVGYIMRALFETPIRYMKNKI